MFSIESLRVIPRIEDDRRRARGSRAAFKFSQNETAETAPLELRINRHEAHLSLSRSIEVQASDSKRA